MASASRPAAGERAPHDRERSARQRTATGSGRSSRRHARPRGSPRRSARPSHARSIRAPASRRTRLRRARTRCASHRTAGCLRARRCRATGRESCRAPDRTAGYSASTPPQTSTRAWPVLQQIDGVADRQQTRRLLLADGDVGSLELQLEAGDAGGDVPDGGVEDERGDVDRPEREELLEEFLGRGSAGGIGAEHDADRSSGSPPYGMPAASSASRATPPRTGWSRRAAAASAAQSTWSARNRSTAAAQRAAHCADVERRHRRDARSIRRASMAANSSTVVPKGETTPSPVTTTRSDTPRTLPSPL